MARIILEGVDLVFRVRTRKQWSLKEYLLGLHFLRANDPVQTVAALTGIDLELPPGSRVGIVGSNGAGKTTLLRTIAGVYPPTAGRCRTEGRVSALFELCVGFELEATGWDNIEYRGLLMGAHPAEIRRRTQEIAEFTELGRFLEVPVKYYSAGMLMRLAFGICTAFEPEILLVDECLSVGDLDFQRKAHARLLALLEQANLFVMVSHEPKALAELCTRVIWLDWGRIIADGPAHQVLSAYVGQHAHETEPVLVAA